MKICCPDCGFCKDVDAGRIPKKTIKVTCPRCATTFPFIKDSDSEDFIIEAVDSETENDTPLSFPPELKDSEATEPPLLAESVEVDGFPLPLEADEPPLPAEVVDVDLLPKAGFWTRVVAALVDGLVVAALQLLLSVALGAVTFSMTSNMAPDVQGAAMSITWIAGSFLSVVYYVFFTGYNGQTLGKMALRIRVIRTDGSSIGYGKAFVREVIGKFISSILLMIGYLLVAFDAKKQGLHDKMAGTYVVKL